MQTSPDVQQASDVHFPAPAQYVGVLLADKTEQDGRTGDLSQCILQPR